MVYFLRCWMDLTLKTSTLDKVIRRDNFPVIWNLVAGGGSSDFYGEFS